MLLTLLVLVNIDSNNIERGSINFTYDDCLKLSVLFNVDIENFYDESLYYLYCDFGVEVLNVIESRELKKDLINKLNISEERLVSLLSKDITFPNRSEFNRFYNAFLVCLNS